VGEDSDADDYADVAGSGDDFEDFEEKEGMQR
jgi:hypothetical protein